MLSSPLLTYQLLGISQNLTSKILPTADQAALPYFYGPVAVILLSNLVIFFFTARAFALHDDKLKDITRE